MSFSIEIISGRSFKLLTKGKYCDRDITVTALKDYTVEDAIFNGTFGGDYYNDRITYIGFGRFAYGAVTSAELPNVTSMSDRAFMNAASLKSLIIPKSTRLWSYMCYNCDKLTDVYAPLATLADTYSMYSCGRLANIELPSLTKINSNAFTNCSVLKKLILSNDKVVTLAAAGALSGTPIAGGTGYVYVPDNLVDSYKTASNWTGYANQIKPLSELEE